MEILIIFLVVFSIIIMQGPVVGGTIICTKKDSISYSLARRPIITPLFRNT